MDKRHEARMEAAIHEAREGALELGLETLLSYVTSPKFAAEPHVNVEDIILRIREIQGYAHDAEAEVVTQWKTCGRCGCSERDHRTYTEYGRKQTYCSSEKCCTTQGPSKCREGFVPSPVPFAMAVESVS